MTLPAPALAPPKAVVFDFGGVLFNWQPRVLIQSVLPHLAGNDEQALSLADRVFKSFVPGSEWSEFDRGALSWDDTREQIAARTGIAAADVHTLMSAIPPHLAPIASSVAWLEALAASGTRLHFLSNMPRPYADFLEREHAFLKHFQSGVFSCDVLQVKPNADIFETAAQQFGIEPEAMVFIDDNIHNVTTARALGWRAVQFVDAAQCQAELAQRGWL
jgi:putative hydrolase of the HAD superfamily